MTYYEAKRSQISKSSLASGSRHASSLSPTTYTTPANTLNSTPRAHVEPESTPPFRSTLPTPSTTRSASATHPSPPFTPKPFPTPFDQNARPPLRCSKSKVMLLFAF
ncbi:hypothetical protein EIP91_008688 [Steccherinum ochraceum]|uniref:Uncharacterized protein n=1 Tax=Steccherinum ochraceum TaxID=92696 RepID=A0A4R0R2I1_9APHY|nr:hypothetical protein EIP91_008688 [Steccherinum ochraceum]